MAIEITRVQRDAIYEEILTELTGSGDVWAEMRSGDYDAARRTRGRLVDGMWLLDDLGWEREQDRELFGLAMDPPDLARALRTLNENARVTLHARIVKPIEEALLAERALVAQTAYGDVLSQIAESGPGESGEWSGG